MAELTQQKPIIRITFDEMEAYMLLPEPEQGTGYTDSQIRQEMEQIAAFLGKKVLGQVTESAFWAALPALRKACGDRAVLRAIHYFEENARTLAQRDALQAGQFDAFAALVLESGRASFALCQNVYCSTDVRHQGLSVALALSQSILQGSTGATVCGGKIVYEAE